MPKRVKYRKEFRRVRDRKATKGNYVAFGDYGLQALEACWLKSNGDRGRSYRGQHYLKREGKLFIRVFPDKPISKKPLETRMGTGKADVDYWAARVRSPAPCSSRSPACPRRVRRRALVRVAMKMPVRAGSSAPDRV
jgi:large subunit ribosomal protein L16